MTSSISSRLVAGVLGWLPRSLHATLDAWSRDIALQRRHLRRHGELRKASPLPPVISSPAALPQSFSS